MIGINGGRKDLPASTEERSSEVPPKDAARKKKRGERVRLVYLNYPPGKREGDRQNSF